MKENESLLERILAAGYKQTYESRDWTVLTRNGKFFAIEKGIDTSARLTGAYSELVTGSYESSGILLADLIRIREDYARISDQASRENAIFVSLALLLILGNAYYRSKTSGIQASDLKYLLISGLIIFGVASFFSAIRGFQIRSAITREWPDRIKRYHLGSSALKQLDMDAEDK